MDDPWVSGLAKRATDADDCADVIDDPQVMRLTTEESGHWGSSLLWVAA